MSMVLTEEQGMLRDTAQGFLKEHAPISQLRRLRDEENPDGFDRATWSGLSEMGFAGVITPEEHGGVGLGYVEAGIIAEEMGRTLTASPYISSSIMGATALKRFGSDGQKSEWLPRLAGGEGLIAVAVDEGRKHAPASVATKAERSGNGFKLSGEKTFVADGSTADGILVTARTSGGENEAEGVTVFLVPHDAKGVSRIRQMTVDSRDAARITLDGVELTADAVIGEVDGGSKVIDQVLDAGRAGLAAEMVGSARQCLETTVDYIKERKQFGEVIGSFQGLQHRAAHLYSEIELARSIVLKTLETLDMAPEHAAMMVSAAKAKLGQTALLATQEAIQMHGGIGMTDEYDIGFFIKRVRVADALYGDANFHAQRYAKLRGF